MTVINNLDADRELDTMELESIGGGVYLPLPFFPILLPVIIGSIL